MLKFRDLWQNKSKIYRGIKNSWIKQEHIELIAEQRLGICNKCPYKEVTIYGDICGICSCVLTFKSRCLSSSCADTPPRWEALLEDKEEDELYNKLGYKPE